MQLIFINYFKYTILSFMIFRMIIPRIILKRGKAVM